MKRKEPVRHQSDTDESFCLPDFITLSALRAVLNHRHHPDRSAALAMWQRIASTDLTAKPLGNYEQEFIQTVARKMIGADQLEAKKRPDAVLAASGLSGKHRPELDSLIERIWSAHDDFESLSPEPKNPKIVSKMHGKRDEFLSIFEPHSEIMSKLQTPENLRKRVEAVRDKRRKK